MPEYVSVNGRLRLPLRAAKEPIYDTSGRMIAEPVNGITIEFDPAGFRPADQMVEHVKRMPDFGRGVGNLNDDPLTRCGYCDVAAEASKYGWTEDEQAWVEATLDGHPDHGMLFLKVVEARISPPWPKYGSAKTANAIVQTIRETGVDPNTVLAYERQNKNRQDVIEAVERLLGEPAELEVVEVTA